MHAKPYHIMYPAKRQNIPKHTYTAERALPKPNLAPPSNQFLCRCPPQAAPHVDGQNLAPNNISTRNKVANDICPAKAHPQSPSDNNTTNNTGNTTGFPYALSLTTPPPRTYAAMASAKTELPARPTQASNLNSVFPLTPPEGPADDPTAEQKNKFSRATLRTQYLLSSLDRLNKSSVTAALHKWKHHTHSYHHIPKTASTITMKVIPHAEKSTPIETSVAGAQHTYKQTGMIQCFLKGPTPQTYTIVVPSPVMRDELGEAMAKKTLVPAGEQRLGPMRNFADKDNVNLLHLPPLITLHMQGGIKGGSGTERQLLYTQVLQAEKIPVRIDPAEPFAILKTILADKTGIPTSEITLFCDSKLNATTQIDDLEQIKDHAQTPGTIIYASRTPVPTTCETHEVFRAAQDLAQKLDAKGTWKWECKNPAHAKHLSFLLKRSRSHPH
jgi:hypothetical protein